jgi:hypothetical protein
MRSSSFVCGLLFAVAFAPIGRSQEDQSRPARLKIEVDSQPAAARLRATADAIRECSATVESEKRWGKRPLEIERWYLGAPQNVVWDIVSGTTVRAPYSGSIEFSMNHYHWVPPETSEKLQRKQSEGTAILIAGQTGTRTVRYEYDIGPAGIELVKASVRFKNVTGASDWQDLEKADVCWDNAARKQPAERSAAR